MMVEPTEDEEIQGAHEKILMGIVRERPGVKETHLVSMLVQEWAAIYQSVERIMESEEILDTLEEMVARKNLIRINYNSLHQPDRVKSLYFIPEHRAQFDGSHNGRI